VSIADSFATEEIERRLGMVGATLCVTCDASLRAGKTIPLYTKVAAARLGAGGYVVCLRAATTAHTSSLSLQRRDVLFDDWLLVRAYRPHTESTRDTRDRLEGTVLVPTDA
jgi:acyl-coenzyme A synthetase/AMP-(fatty) acid ligase